MSSKKLVSNKTKEGRGGEKKNVGQLRVRDRAEEREREEGKKIKFKDDEEFVTSGGDEEYSENEGSDGESDDCQIRPSGASSLPWKRKKKEQKRGSKIISQKSFEAHSLTHKIQEGEEAMEEERKDVPSLSDGMFYQPEGDQEEREEGESDLKGDEDYSDSERGWDRRGERERWEPEGEKERNRSEERRRPKGELSVTTQFPLDMENASVFDVTGHRSPGTLSPRSQNSFSILNSPPSLHSPLLSPSTRVVSPPNRALLSPPSAALLSSGTFEVGKSMQMLPPSIPHRSQRTMREKANEQKFFYENYHSAWHQTPQPTQQPPIPLPQSQSQSQPPAQNQAPQNCQQQNQRRDSFPTKFNLPSPQTQASSDPIDKVEKGERKGDIAFPFSSSPSHFPLDSQVIYLDVGGQTFKCSRSTLLSTPSMLSAMFSGRHHQEPSCDGKFFIDRDPTYFPFILNWLRDRSLSYLDYAAMNSVSLLRILKESLFYQIHPLNEELLYHYSKRARREWTHPWIHLSENELVMTRNDNGSGEWCFAIIGDPVLPSVGGVYYWEVLVHHTSRQVMVGVMPPYPRKVHNTHIGKIPDGKGYHCNGHLYQNNTCHGFGPTFTNGDRVGTLLDLDTGHLSWFVNGEQTHTVSVAKKGGNSKGYVFAITLCTPKDCIEILPNAECIPSSHDSGEGELSQFENTGSNSGATSSIL